MLKLSYLTRKQEKILILIACVTLTAIILVSTIFYYHVIKIPSVIRTQQELQMSEEEKRISNEVNVVVLKNKAVQGIAITQDMLDYQKLPRDRVPEGVLLQKNLAEGKVPRIDLPKGTQLVPEMLVDYNKVVTPDLRLQDFSFIRLITGLAKSTQEKQQYVDVRIKRPDGTDEVVLSKKEVKDLGGNTVFFDIDEMERTYINNAAVEAQMKSCDIYTTLYIDPQNQPPAAVTYKINSDIAKMIEINPNIVNQSVQQLEEKNNALQPQPTGTSLPDQQPQKDQSKTNLSSGQPSDSLEADWQSVNGGQPVKK